MMIADTDVLIDFLEGRSPTAERLALELDRGQRITVAGWTTETASAQPLQSRDSRTQNSRSERRNRGRGAVR